MGNWESSLDRWIKAGLIDEAAAQRIRDYEAAHERRSRLPVVLAIAFGVLLLGAGVLLFVAAHWDALSPAQRFALVLALVAVFHVAAGFFHTRNEHLGAALHSVGTVVLGAGIFLTGQIFHLQEHWPGGLMLWALGAAVAWLLLRQWPQIVLLAILAPAWLWGEWDVRIDSVYHRGEYVAAAGLLLLSLVYLAAVRGPENTPLRRSLMWLGGLSLLPLTIWTAFSSYYYSWRVAQKELPVAAIGMGWALASGLPLLLAWRLRARESAASVVAAVWVAGFVWISRLCRPEDNAGFYVWSALGAIGLIYWGVRDKRKERLNLGIAAFGLTVLGFYFSSFADKLGRSATMISLGILFLAGGWYLEKTRRKLIAHMGVNS